MKELGHGENYSFMFRHLVLQANETIELEAEGQFYVLTEDVSDVRINSDMAVYDLADTALNEQSYEHQGAITINNYSQTKNHLVFIQVIPNN